MPVGYALGQHEKWLQQGSPKGGIPAYGYTGGYPVTATGQEGTLPMSDAYYQSAIQSQQYYDAKLENAEFKEELITYIEEHGVGLSAGFFITGLTYLSLSHPAEFQMIYSAVLSMPGSLLSGIGEIVKGIGEIFPG